VISCRESYVRVKVTEVRLISFNRFYALLAILVLLSVCQPAAAQEPQISALAQQISDSLSRAKAKSVAVFAFVGPDEPEALGQSLADDFREDLAKSAKDVQVIALPQLLTILGKTAALSASVNDADTASWFLRDTGVDSFVIGSISRENGGLQIVLKAFHVRGAREISSFEASIVLTDDLKALVSLSRGREFATWPRGGENGYSSPICLSCPQLQYHGPPIPGLYQKFVVLEITVDEEGRARHIRVKKALLNGMTEDAIATVKTWRFKPSTGPDGKPAAVRMIVQVTLKSY
jgi:TonB family protein